MDIPPEVHQSIIASIPQVSATFEKLYDLPGAMLPSGEAHVGLASACLENVAELLQHAGKAIYHARCEWHKHQDRRVAGYPEQAKHLVAVHFTRFYFDHAANSLYATMNHLAAAMWHLHEREDSPLGNKYQFPDRVRRVWRERPSAPASLPLLESVLDAPAWVTVKEYRDRWTHREVPVIEGEVRKRRRALWRDITEPAPPSYLMAHVDESAGKVAYLCFGVGDHEYTMPGLMDAATEALRLVVGATEGFLVLVRQVYQSHGWSFED